MIFYLQSLSKAEQDIENFNKSVLAGEISITQEYRNHLREQAKLNSLKLEGLESQKRLLEEQKIAISDQYQALLTQLQNETFISSLTKKKVGGIIGFGKKTEAVEVRQTLNGLSFEEMEKLFSEGRLTGRAKELFETLKKIKQEGADVDGLLKENKVQIQELFTGTTSSSIADSIIDGFRDGKRSAADFAEDFQGYMQQAMLNALKFKYLEGPLNDFFASFAEDAESGGGLTSGEIDRLRAMYKTILECQHTV